MYEASGKIKLINDTQSFPSGFTKREFVVTTGADKYPQDLKFEIVKDKCTLLDAFEPGQDVHVTFDIRGNEYNGKYYVSLSCWKIQGSDGGAAEPSRGGKPASRSQASPAAAHAEPSINELRDNDDDFDDDVPF